MLRLKQTDTGALVIPPVLVDAEESAKAALWNLFSTQAQDEMQATSDGVVEVVGGEWPFSKSHGIKWRGSVFGKYFSPDETRAIIALTANKVPEVQRVTPSQVTLEYDAEFRQVQITLSNVRLTSGETVDAITISVAV